MEVEGTDPWGLEMSWAEWVGLMVGAVVYLVDLVAVVYLWINRSYPPLVVRQLTLVLASLLASFLWWLGTAASQRVIVQANNPVFLQCTLWGDWLQLTFGLFLWLCCLLFRFFRIYAIVIHRIRFTARYRIAFFIFWLPGILLSAFSQGLGWQELVHEPDGVVHCDASDVFIYAVLAVLVLYYATAIYFIVRLRNVKQKYLKEYRENRAVLAIFTLLYVISLILLVLKVRYYIWGRVISLFLILGCTQAFFWITVGSPLYHLLVDREEHLQLFLSQLNDLSSSNNDPSQFRSTVANTTNTTLTTYESKKEDHDRETIGLHVVT